MSTPSLAFVDGAATWNAERDSVRFIGSGEGREFAFLASSEALGAMEPSTPEPTDRECMDIFHRHQGAFFALAMNLWAHSNREADEYLINAEFVEANPFVR